MLFQLLIIELIKAITSVSIMAILFKLLKFQQMKNHRQQETGFMEKLETDLDGSLLSMYNQRMTMYGFQ